MGRLRLLGNDLRRGWRLVEQYPEPIAGGAGAAGLVMYWQDVFPDVAMLLFVGGVVFYGLLTAGDGSAEPDE